MSSIKALEELRGIAERMDEMAAGESEHGFSPLAISIKNLLGKVEDEIAERETRSCPHYHADRHYCDIHETRINALNERIDELTRKLEDFEGDCYCGATVVEWHELACKLQDRVDELQAALNAKEQLERDSAYMRLPVDADGVPIRMGDTVEGELFFDNATVKGTVSAYHIYDDEPGKVYIRVNPTEDTWTIKELQFKRCRHVQPDTVESLLDEMLEEARCRFHEDGSCEKGVTYGRRAEYAERIRKAVKHG